MIYTTKFMIYATPKTLSITRTAKIEREHMDINEM